MSIYSKIARIFFLISLLLSLAWGSVGGVNAAYENPYNVLQQAGGETGYNRNVKPTAFPEEAGRFISVFLSLIGVIFVVLAFYAGFLWFTAQGDAAKVDKAKTLLTQATVGLMIVVFAYAITYFVVENLSEGPGLLDPTIRGDF